MEATTLNTLARIDLLLQYVLAIAAAEDDFRDRELGPIHLLKYVYLSDLAHAERHSGQTYTGVRWGFFHFGPWSAEVFDRISPALRAIGVEPRRISSPYADDLVRYRLDPADAEHLRARLESAVPQVIQIRIAPVVHQFGSDTATLLRAVYLSAPMVNAAPGEELDFAIAARESKRVETASEGATSPATKRQKRRRVAEIRAEVQRRLQMRSGVSAPPEPQPRYDDVFVEGVEWLDRLAGEQVPSVSGDITIGEDIWKSDARRGPDEIP